MGSVGLLNCTAYAYVQYSLMFSWYSMPYLLDMMNLVSANSASNLGTLCWFSLGWRFVCGILCYRRLSCRHLLAPWLGQHIVILVQLVTRNQNCWPCFSKLMKDAHFPVPSRAFVLFHPFAPGVPPSPMSDMLLQSPASPGSVSMGWGTQFNDVQHGDNWKGLESRYILATCFVSISSVMCCILIIQTIYFIYIAWYKYIHYYILYIIYTYII